MPQPRRRTTSSRNASPQGTSLSTSPLAAGLVRFAHYARVSTEAQADKEISIPAQQSACRAYGHAQGWTLAGEYDDPGVSGSTLERPGLGACLSAAKAGEFDILLVHKLDRLSRSPGDTFAIKAMLQSAGARLVSVTEHFVGGEHPMDEAMEGMAITFNRLHIANLKTEIRKGMRQIVNPEGREPVGPDYDAPGRGRMGGPLPYGYRLIQPGVRGSLWEADGVQAEWVRFAYEQVAGGLMIAELCRTLNALGAPPPSMSAGWRAKGRVGGVWQFQALRQILGNRVYRGHVHFEDQWYPGAHPALVSFALWARVQQVLADRAPGRAEKSPALFAGGMLRCPRCAAGGVQSWLYAQHTETPGRYRYTCGAYERRGDKRRAGAIGVDYAEMPDCAGFSLSERKALRLLRAYLAEIALLITPEDKEKAQKETARLAAQEMLPPLRPSSPPAAQREALLKEQESLPALRQKYQRLAARDLMTEDELAGHLAELAGRQAVIAERLAVMDTQPPPAPQITAITAHQLLQMLDDENLTALQKRDRLRMEIDYLVPAEDKLGLSVHLA